MTQRITTPMAPIAKPTHTAVRSSETQPFVSRFIAICHLRNDPVDLGASFLQRRKIGQRVVKLDARARVVAWSGTCETSRIFLVLRLRDSSMNDPCNKRCRLVEKNRQDVLDRKKRGRAARP